MSISNFHDVRFPTDIARGATGGPMRRTEVITLASGREQRNARWKHSRRSYNAGYGIKTVDALNEVIDFFEQRRGKLCGFRFRDPVDFKSCKPGKTVSNEDQLLGEGDGTQSIFQLVKNYGMGDDQYTRTISKPVDATVTIAIDGVDQIEGTNFTVDTLTGEVSFLPGSIPSNGAEITAGYEFDVPVRFDMDEIVVNLKAFSAGDIPSIPLVELR